MRTKQHGLHLGLFCIRGHGAATMCPTISYNSAVLVVTQHSQVFTAASVLHWTAVHYQDCKTSQLDLGHAILALTGTSAKVFPLNITTSHSDFGPLKFLVEPSKKI